MLEVDVDAEAERGREQAAVAGAHQPGQGGEIGCGPDGVELGGEGAGAERVDRGLVHVCRVEGADLALDVRRFQRGGRGRFAQDPHQLRLGAVAHVEAAGGDDPVGRDLGAGEIAAVGELEEVVARLHGAVERGQVIAERRKKGGARGVLSYRCRGC